VARGKYIFDYLYDEDCDYIATDYTAFESHFTKETMEAIDRLLFEHMLSRRSDAHYWLELFDTYINNWNNCTFKYISLMILCTRMSGEMNTSMSNGFANLMLTKFILFKKGIDAKTVVEGDDGLTAIRKGLDIGIEDFKKYGFTIKLDRFSKLNEASFCGLIFDPNTFDVVADPMKFLLNFFYTSGRYATASDRTLRALLKAKAMSTIVQYPNAPVISAVAQYAYRMTRNVSPKVCLLTGDDRHKYINISRFKNIVPIVTPESRLLVEKMFNFPITLQREIESLFNNKNDFLPWRSEEFYEMCHVDTKIYYDNYASQNPTPSARYPGNIWPKFIEIPHTIAANIIFDGKSRDYRVGSSTQ